MNSYIIIYFKKSAFHSNSNSGLESSLQGSTVKGKPKTRAMHNLKRRLILTPFSALTNTSGALIVFAYLRANVMTYWRYSGGDPMKRSYFVPTSTA